MSEEKNLADLVRGSMGPYEGKGSNTTWYGRKLLQILSQDWEGFKCAVAVNTLYRCLQLFSVLSEGRLGRL